MRYFLALLAVVLVAPLAQAQTEFGLKAGLNVSTINGFPDFEFVDQPPRLGVVAGVWGRYAFSPQIGVQLEALYSQKGTRQRYNFEDDLTRGGASEVDYNIDYLEIPLLVRFAPDVNPTLDVGIYAGPSVGFKISESVSFDGGEFDGTLFTGSDVGVAVGADVASGPFGVDLRYTFGLTDINADEAVVRSGIETTELTNGTFSAAFVYRFGK